MKNYLIIGLVFATLNGCSQEAKQQSSNASPEQMAVIKAARQSTPKYSPDEINMVVEHAAELRSFAIQGSALVKKHTALIDKAYKSGNKKAVENATVLYKKAAMEFQEAVDRLRSPASNLENEDASYALIEAHQGLAGIASSIVDVAISLGMPYRLEKLGLSTSEEESALEIKQGIVDNRQAQATLIISIAKAYAAYGYASTSIDDKTFRLKAGSVPTPSTSGK
ncbi:MAG: hypothetical protein A3I66_01250 [Burkholderiales bacterium RIFCSPLOWO2_02_FULL_57_36]|nr:MAG: hypothetical protein A3I66_01250 [Burkholderiales bacterium RIFCSPLOWO2_02_FULL_57_36]